MDIASQGKIQTIPWMYLGLIIYTYMLLAIMSLQNSLKKLSSSKWYCVKSYFWNSDIDVVLFKKIEKKNSAHLKFTYRVLKTGVKEMNIGKMGPNISLYTVVGFHYTPPLTNLLLADSPERATLDFFLRSRSFSM